MRPFDPNVDYYAILQVHPHAHREVIKRAYRTIVSLLQAHPDLGGSHEDAIRVNTAYLVLSNEDTRRAYDLARQRVTVAQLGKSHAAATSAYATQRPHRGNGNSTANAAFDLLRCPRCGTQNRVPVTANRHRALCGKCRVPLTTPLRARASGLPSGEVRLSAALTQQLRDQGELRLQRAHLPRDGQLRCLRCRHIWQANGAESLPGACPSCGSQLWSDFRLFRCHHCDHRFVSENLHTWPYWLFPQCPACHQSHWHDGCEKHPLQWMLTKLAG